MRRTTRAQDAKDAEKRKSKKCKPEVLAGSPPRSGFVQLVIMLTGAGSILRAPALYSRLIGSVPSRSVKHFRRFSS